MKNLGQFCVEINTQPSIDLYGTHVLDAHCKLIEANKPVLKIAMAFAWVAFAAFVVLSA